MLKSSRRVVGTTRLRSERQARRADATQRQVDEERSPGTTCPIGNMELGAGQALAWRGFALLDDVQPSRRKRCSMRRSMRCSTWCGESVVVDACAATSSSMCTLCCEPRSALRLGWRVLHVAIRGNVVSCYFVAAVRPKIFHSKTDTYGQNSTVVPNITCQMLKE